MKKTPPGIGQRASESRLERLPLGLISVLEFLVLGILAAAVALIFVPRLLEIESSGIGPYGAETQTGDTFIGGLVVFGTIGCIAIFLATLYAEINESRWAVLLLPLAWFLVFLVGTTVVVALVGPTPCPT